MFPSYAELHCLTNFTFLRGASHPEELIERAARLGYSALAVTDECSLAGVVRAHVAAKEHGIKLIVGTEVVSPSPLAGEGWGEGGLLASRRAPLASRSAALRIVLLATDRTGYGNLSELITRARRRSKKGEYHFTAADLDDGVPGCLALLLPGEEPDPGHARWLGSRFAGRCWIAAELLLGPDDHARLEQLESHAQEAGLPLVAAGDVHMHVRARRALHDTLTAVRLGTPLGRCGQALFPNGERYLRSRERLARLYPPELLIATVDVAERCSFSLDSLRYEYPEEIVPAGETPVSWLRKLTEDGFRWRFGASLREAGGGRRKESPSPDPSPPTHADHVGRNSEADCAGSGVNHPAGYAALTRPTSPLPEEERTADSASLSLLPPLAGEGGDGGMQYTAACPLPGPPPRPADAREGALPACGGSRSDGGSWVGLMQEAGGRPSPQSSPRAENPSSLASRLTPPASPPQAALGWGSHFTAGRSVDIHKARALVEHELALIAELQYEPYFLTVYDVVKFARSQGILCQGRGSAANSAVCYCLGVTEVDPARMDMLFERFISRERNEPPDIDVDFEHERREEVIQYIYGKYGRDRAALAATVITYRPKSALRDVGKALGLDLAQVDRLAKSLAWWDGRKVRPERLREMGFDPDSPVIRKLVALVNIIVGFPRHLSQHVGGFVISRGPLSTPGA